MLRVAASSDEPTIVRRAFEAWSVEVPVSMTETFVEEDSYWHAWDEHRSISLTSIVVTDKRGRPVTADQLTGRLPVLDGDPFEELPSGLIGQATTGPIEQPARAATALTGLLATDGRVLLATITSDDLDWARRVWLSLRPHPALIWQPPRRERRTMARRRR